MHGNTAMFATEVKEEVERRVITRGTIEEMQEIDIPDKLVGIINDYMHSKDFSCKTTVCFYIPPEVDEGLVKEVFEKYKRKGDRYLGDRHLRVSLREMPKGLSYMTRGWYELRLDLVDLPGSEWSPRWDKNHDGEQEG